MNFTVASISSGVMTLSSPATLPIGALLTSPTIAFAGTNITGQTDSTHYTILNTSIT